VNKNVEHIRVCTVNGSGFAEERSGLSPATGVWIL